MPEDKKKTTTMPKIPGALSGISSALYGTKIPDKSVFSNIGSRSGMTSNPMSVLHGDKKKKGF